MKIVASLAAAFVLLSGVLATAQAGGGWVNGHYRGPPDGYCWNNKKGC